MKQKEKAVYTKRVTVRLKEAEYIQLESQFKKTTCRKFSDYLRNVMLAKPITIKYRNASADDFLTEMIGLKNELSAIGKNFNQEVKRLHLLEKMPEFRSWILTNRSMHQVLLNSVEEIRFRMNQIYEQWLQK
jgi:hypothetical protein